MGVTFSNRRHKRDDDAAVDASAPDRTTDSLVRHQDVTSEVPFLADVEPPTAINRPLRSVTFTSDEVDASSGPPQAEMLSPYGYARGIQRRSRGSFVRASGSQVFSLRSAAIPPSQFIGISASYVPAIVASTEAGTGHDTMTSLSAAYRTVSGSSLSSAAVDRLPDEMEGLDDLFTSVTTVSTDASGQFRISSASPSGGFADDESNNA